jgi:hypothetical protein
VLTASAETSATCSRLSREQRGAASGDRPPHTQQWIVVVQRDVENPCDGGDHRLDRARLREVDEPRSAGSVGLRSEPCLADQRVARDEIGAAPTTPRLPQRDPHRRRVREPLRRVGAQGAGTTHGQTTFPSSTTR